MGILSEMEDYSKAFEDHGAIRKLFTSAGGYFGLGPGFID